MVEASVPRYIKNEIDLKLINEETFNETVQVLLLEKLNEMESSYAHDSKLAITS